MIQLQLLQWGEALGRVLPELQKGQHVFQGTFDSESSGVVAFETQLLHEGATVQDVSLLLAVLSPLPAIPMLRSPVHALVVPFTHLHTDPACGLTQVVHSALLVCSCAVLRCCSASTRGTCSSITSRYGCTQTTPLCCKRAAAICR
jgi:hypothetical protein